MTEKATVTLLEGVFYEDPSGALTVPSSTGARSVESAFKELEGEKVILVVHHAPLDPPDQARWGGGCCMYEPSGSCPVGHHERKGYLYTFKHAGTLECHGSKWGVTTDQGRHEPWLASLVGHRSQIVISAIPDVEDLKAKLNLDEQPKNLEDLEARITAMRDLFVQVNDLKDNL